MNNDMIRLEKQCEELRASVSALQKKLVSQEHSQAANQAWLKEFDALKARAEKAEAKCLSLRLAVDDGIVVLHDKLQKAEADINALNKLLRKAGWGQGEIDYSATLCEELEKKEAEVAELKNERVQFDELYSLMPDIENRYSERLYFHLRQKLLQLTQLQQDVRPLLAELAESATISRARKALETFLAKHPELNP